MEDKQVRVEEVEALLAAEVHELAQKIAETLNAAQAGRIIADTEEPVRQAHAVFREQAYAKALGLLQQRQEAFSPSARRVPEQRDAAHDVPDGQRACDGA